MPLTLIGLLEDEGIEWGGKWEVVKGQLFRESERASAIVSSALLDETLATVIGLFMIDEDMKKRDDREVLKLIEDYGVLGTFSARTRTAYSLGLITEDEHHDLHIIRTIRNKFAHDLECSFDDPSVADRCNNLVHPRRIAFLERQCTARQKYELAVYQIGAALAMRFADVKSRRCVVLPEMPFDPTGITHT